MRFEQPDECREDVLEFLRSGDSQVQPKGSAYFDASPKAVRGTSNRLEKCTGNDRSRTLVDLSIAEGKLTLNVRGAVLTRDSVHA
jgi:hypothetical protein